MGQLTVNGVPYEEYLKKEKEKKKGKSEFPFIDYLRSRHEPPCLMPSAYGIPDLREYKKESKLDSGYFYYLYVPKIDPNSFSPHKGIMTKYSKKLLKEGAKFYARLPISCN